MNSNLTTVLKGVLGLLVMLATTSIAIADAPIPAPMLAVNKIYKGAYSKSGYPLNLKKYCNATFKYYIQEEKKKVDDRYFDHFPLLSELALANEDRLREVYMKYCMNSRSYANSIRHLPFDKMVERLAEYDRKYIKDMLRALQHLNQFTMNKYEKKIPNTLFMDPDRARMRKIIYKEYDNNRYEEHPKPPKLYGPITVESIPAYVYIKGKDGRFVKKELGELEYSVAFYTTAQFKAVKGSGFDLEAYLNKHMDGFAAAWDIFDTYMAPVQYDKEKDEYFITFKILNNRRSEIGRRALKDASWGGFVYNTDHPEAIKEFEALPLYEKVDHPYSGFGLRGINYALGTNLYFYMEEDYDRAHGTNRYD